VPAGVSWEEVQDHIKIAHHPLLVPLAERILHRLQALIAAGSAPECSGPTCPHDG